MATPVESEVPVEIRVEEARMAIDKANLASREAYKRQLPGFLRVLPQEERENLLNDPVEFTSEKFLFRGMTAKKMADLLQTGIMKPESGHMNSIAVFETDSPYMAITFEGGIRPALAVIDKDKIVVNGQLYDVGDVRYKEAIRKLEQNPPPGVDKKSFQYEIQNYVDDIAPAHPNHNWHNYELRSPQPISEVKYFLVDMGTEPMQILDPANPRHMQELRKLYLPQE